ncbi:HK97 gp10 family phage protein [Actinokineospora baliensis]|uniref:hypothetical protein n=1 Tax=Actinokineospora baliensis TaxID=547056 RepID=UPI00195AD3F2|nr:hypothetical protein [Actinokineospora baliensis]MBM7770898.1 HK97 gp10 family phage protein [Actinokineospora baliensis]
MPPPLRFQVGVQGHKQLIAAFRRLRDSTITKELKAVHKDTAAVVVPAARSDAPRRSGALSASVAPSTNQKAAIVRAGRGRSALYAAVIHFGWPKRGIRPRRFLFTAAAEKSTEYRDLFRARMTALIDRAIGSDK